LKSWLHSVLAATPDRALLARIERGQATAALPNVADHCSREPHLRQKPR
jgi:hypothetical protein